MSSFLLVSVKRKVTLLMMDHHLLGFSEVERTNKFHYAFSFFKKPLKLANFSSTILKKATEAPKKEVKEVKPAKTKKVGKPLRVTHRLALSSYFKEPDWSWQSCACCIFTLC